MEINVTGCEDCPMLDSGAEYEYQCFCLHPKAPRQFSEIGDSVEQVNEIIQIGVDEDWDRNPTHIPITPKWCPLNTEPITITKNK